jgi:hypothetical protein
MTEKLVHTACYHSRDATRQDEWYSFQCGAGGTTFRASKVALGSFEFPMVQPPIDVRKNRVHVSESIHLESPLEVRVTESGGLVSAADQMAYQITIPATVNRIVKVERKQDGMHVVTEKPHAMTYKALSSNMFEFLGVSPEEDAVVFDLEENECSFTLRGCTTEPRALYFHPFPDVAALCSYVESEWKTHNASARCHLLGDGRVEFACRPKRSVGRGGSEMSRRIALEGSLLRYMGHGDVQVTDNASDVVVIASFVPTSLWKEICLSPGWYVPASKPCTTGQPIRLSQEFSLQANRLHFLPRSTDSEKLTDTFLVFRVGGIRMDVPVMYGIYTARTFAEMVNAHCTVHDDEHDVVVRMAYERSRFIISARRGDGKPCLMSVLFEDPLSLSPTRLGFPEGDLHGQSRYSSDVIVVPDLLNHYEMVDTAASGMLTLRAVQVPDLSLVPHSSHNGVVSGSLFFQQYPFVTSFQIGTAVVLEPAGRDHRICGYGGDAEDERTVPGARGRDVVTAVVIEVTGNRVVIVASASVELERAYEVRVRPRSFSLLSDVLPGSVSRRLGYSLGVHTLRDGSFSLSADGVCNLEHVDYVLIYLDSGNVGTTLSHQYDSNTTNPFVKLVMYPAFREERMLPRDMQLTSGHSFSHFRLSVRNPDGSEYDFRGADFSFSLNYVYM